jgi:hypothetical protein
MSYQSVQQYYGSQSTVISDLLSSQRKRQEVIAYDPRVNAESYLQPPAVNSLNPCRIEAFGANPEPALGKLQNPAVGELDVWKGARIEPYAQTFQPKWATVKYADTKDPEVWGPPLWFGLHNGAAHYPDEASPVAIEQAMMWIKSLPVQLTCKTCKEHATAHIERNMDRLPEICRTRENLEKFFVDLHNIVNKRYGKPQFSYEQARKMYRGGADVRVLKY